MLRRRRSKGDADDNVVIDLTDHVPTPEQHVALEEQRLQLQRRRETAEELARLRARHWSADRVLEEGQLDIEFWEHSLADPYAVLGILPGASIAEAAAARKRIALECHPDLGDDVVDPKAAERMRAANNAFERIRQMELRRLAP